MAALPVIPDCWRVAFNWTNAAFTRPATTVMHFKGTGIDGTDIFTALDGKVTAAMWTQTPSSTSCVNIECTPLDGSGLTSVHVTGSPAKWSGGAGATDIVPQVAVLLKITTAKRGRSYRGRAYLPWVSEGQMNSGSYSGGSVTAQQAAWSTFLTGIKTTVILPVVASYKLSTAEEVMGYTIEPLLATQRRRQPR